MSDYRIHLVYRTWPSIEFLDSEIKPPAFLKYGHVFCLLEKDGEIIETEITLPFHNHSGNENEAALPENLEVATESHSSKGRLKRFFEKALKISEISYLGFRTYYTSDETDTVASFNIDEAGYKRLYDHILERNHTNAPYNRLTRNCVFYAAQDLKTAGIDFGNGWGYTAGRFFEKVQKSSKGNLLIDGQSTIQVIERSVALPREDDSKRPRIVREIIDINQIIN
jgi:hypothetical protein